MSVYSHQQAGKVYLGDNAMLILEWTACSSGEICGGAGQGIGTASCSLPCRSADASYPGHKGRQ